MKWNIKCLFVCSFMLVICYGCFSEEIVAEQKKVSSTVNAYLDARTRHRYDSDWNEKYVPIFLHTDFNPFGTPSKFKTVMDTIESHRGLNVISGFSIIRVEKKKDVVDFVKEKPMPEDTYFVYVRYKLIATTKSAGFVVLDKPENADEIIVLAKDVDGQYKIIDNYPDPQAFFYDKNYFIEQYDRIVRGYKINNQNDKKRIIEQLGKDS